MARAEPRTFGFYFNATDCTARQRRRDEIDDDTRASYYFTPLSRDFFFFSFFLDCDKDAHARPLVARTVVVVVITGLQLRSGRVVVTYRYIYIYNNNYDIIL